MVAQVPPGTVVVEAPTDLPPAEGDVFADAVTQALAGADFQPLPSPGHSRYVARFTVVRTERGAVNTRIAPDRARGAAGNWGATVAVPLASGKTSLRALVATELRIEISRRGDPAVLWSGRALTVQAEGSAGDAPAAIAPKLAHAIIGQFPAQSAEPAAVP